MTERVPRIEKSKLDHYQASAIVARCIIQGVGECEPVTGKPNIDALWQELADVRATSLIAADHFDLPPGEMERRCSRKKLHLRAWHDLIRGLPWSPPEAANRG